MRFQPSRLRHRPTPKTPMPCTFEPALGRELLALRGSCCVVQVRPTEFLLWPSQQLGYSCERRESSEGTNTKPKSSVPVVGRLVNPAALCSQ